MNSQSSFISLFQCELYKRIKIILQLIEKTARLIDAYGLPLINVSRKLDQELISFRNVTNEVKRTEGEDAKFY